MQRTSYRARGTRAPQPRPMVVLTDDPIAFRIGRYSAAEGDDQLERQDADTLRMVQMNGWEDGGFRGFVAESGNEDTRLRQGRRGERPSLTWLRQMVALHGPNRPVRVVAWKWDRLFRDVSEKERIYREFAAYPDVLLHTGEGVRNPKSANDRMLSTIETAMAQHYADSTREKIVRAHQERLAKRLPPTGWPAFGHTWRDPEHSGWSVVPEEARMIREAADAVLHGATVTSVAERWNAAGSTTRRGNPWTITSVRDVLRAPRIAGILVYSGEEHGPTDAIEAIIDEPKFRAVAATIDRRLRGPKGARTALAGILLCGFCESTLTSGGKGGRRYYGCRQCGKIGVQGDVAEEVIRDLIAERLSSPSFAQKLAEDSVDADELYLELAAQQEEMRALEELADDLPVAMLARKSKAITARIDEIHDQLARITGATVEPWQDEGRRIVQEWTTTLASVRRELALAVVGRLKVMPGVPGRRATRESVAARLVPA